MSSLLQKISAWFRRTASSAEEILEGEEPVATPAPGTPGDSGRETSTNEQLEGASGEPWSDQR